MNQKKLSIVIPTLNEEGNIQPLFDGINDALKSKDIEYEIIVVDDHSSDQTEANVNLFKTKYPVSFYSKQGVRGKAQSLIEGFKYAKYDLICIIDADLQYPPEAIPLLVDKISDKVDIVIANRNRKDDSIFQKFITLFYGAYFTYYLHGLMLDTQSGLKVFKKEIVERISLKPTPWTFDMEFLLKARHAGYKISQVNVKLGKRHYGKQKGNLFKSIFELGFRSIYLKLKRLDPIPFSTEMEKKEGAGFHHKGEKYIHHSGLQIDETAFHRFSQLQIFLIFGIFILLITGLVISWHTTVVYLIVTLTFLYFADLLFNLSLIYRSFAKDPDIKISDEEINKVTDWPSYTILCPLYKESHVLPQFVSAISKLDYPKDKLQVLIILEEDDMKTIESASKYKMPDYFKTLIVPHSLPKTKPKALNYAIKFATGQYVVVYDAEDVPESTQLKKAVVAFGKVSDKVVCFQAKLNFYNPHQNLLTRVFTAEYSLWFDLVLTGLQSINAPIPLGGTSNHFKTKDLVALKGWDSFNVTEDCDLGMRLVKHGFKTAIFDSITLEEANSGMMNWFRQRTRWVKGYIQTYFLHMRRPKDFISNLTDFNLLTFQLVVGGKVLSMIVNPIMWVITICYFAFRANIGLFIESFFPTPILYMGVLSLVIGNFLYMYYYMIGTARHGHHELVKYTFLVPFYWLGMSMAAYYSLFKFIVDPHYWAKTKHGLHLRHSKIVINVGKLINGKALESLPSPIELILNKLLKAV